ncbi:MAG: 4-hydroxy-3-methylbut-2-enyl diphosphate reductase [Syntrophales bacterium]|nr:4-hydroxy-3-methylbut-2-enyl diphosphate reductase [Syntrophales bacterium]
MLVKLAKTAGFCMGVRRAVDIVLDIARQKGTGPVYTYGELIHNPQTVELLKRRGIVPVRSIDEIDGGTVVVRAHGISPREGAQLKEKGVTIIDATCPRVARVQAIIRKHASRGYDIIIVGDRKHPEVTGLLGYAEPRGTVIADIEDINDLPSLGRVCVVAQTTQNTAHFEKMVKKIEEKFPEALVFNTICDSTERRQSEIKRMAGEMDAMIIVGGRNSANTKQLLNISLRAGIPSFQIETAEELNNIDLEKTRKIGVSAGASTPNWITDSVVDYLNMYRKGRGAGSLLSLYSLWILTIRTDIYSALGAGLLATVGMILQGLEVNLINVLVAALYVYSMHTLNRIQDRYLGRIQGNFRDETYLRHRNVYKAVAFFSLILALLLSFYSGIASFLVLLIISLFGYLYSFRVFPSGWPVKSLRDIPGSKNIFIALAWAVVAALIPPIGAGETIGLATALTFIIVFLIVFMKSVITDMVDVQSDRLVGRETFPVVMGEYFSRRLVKRISIVAAAILVASPATGLMPAVTISLIVPVFYVWICLELCDRKARFSSTALEGFFGTIYIIAGVSVIAWAAVERTLP